MVISIPYQSVAIKVSAVQQPPWNTQEMPRNVITFTHAQARQISIHEAVDIPHFVTFPESPVTLKLTELRKVTFRAAEGIIYYVAIERAIFSGVKITCYFYA